jgi:transcriptional regulator with XRE-family HTH domain
MKVRFNELIRDKDYTIESLAKKAGVNPRSLEQYSSGRYSLRNARAYIIVAIADALKMHPRDLIALDD